MNLPFYSKRCFFCNEDLPFSWLTLLCILSRMVGKLYRYTDKDEKLSPMNQIKL